MSHNIEHFVFDGNADRVRVEANLNNYAAMADRGEGSTGLGSKIRWLDKVCDTEADAHDYIKSVDKGWYDQIAVRFRVPVETAKTKDLRDRLMAAREKAREADAVVHFANVKSAFISCPNCKSKIAQPYIKTNFCPICHADLRPASALDKVQKAVQKCRVLEEKLRQAERDAAKKGKVKWLVKIEYHT